MSWILIGLELDWIGIGLDWMRVTCSGFLAVEEEAGVADAVAEAVDDLTRGGAKRRGPGRRVAHSEGSATSALSIPSRHQMDFD